MIVHTIPSIAEVAAGPTYSVVRLCDGLVSAGCPIELLAIDKDGHRSVPAYTRLFRAGPPPTRLGICGAMAHWLEDEARSGSIQLLHNHSLWMMPNVYPGRVAARHGIPYIVSPRGTLASGALRSGSWVKSVFWPLVQAPALRAVTLFHATSEGECEDIRARGFNQPVAVIPNGVDMPPIPQRSDGPPTVLFVGRIHPSKGVGTLLHAWARVAERHPSWRLRIVGPDNAGHLKLMQKLAHTLNLPRTSFDGALMGASKWKAYRDASVYALPTQFENFGMTVAESLSMGTPVIVTKGAPWQGLETNHCGWWIDAGVEACTDALDQAMRTPLDELRQMGDRGRVWMASSFAWNSIVERMRSVYDWVFNGMLLASRPSCVRLPRH